MHPKFKLCEAVREYWVGRIWFSGVYWTRIRSKHWFIVILPLQPIDEKLETKLMIVYLQIALKLKPHEIAHRLNVSIEEVKDSIRIFRWWMKLRRRVNIRFLGKHKIIKEEHKRYAYQLITNKTIWPLTLTELKSKLVNKYPCLT